MPTDIFLVITAGICAGIVTGFFGGSATLVLVPLLVTFGGYHPYTAIGLALSVDIFSSLSAFRIYKNRREINLKAAAPLIGAAVIGVLAGSFLSVAIPEKILSVLVGFGVLTASLRFWLASANLTAKPDFLFRYGKPASVLWGLASGLGLGIVGGGGGIVLLMGLTVFLEYPLHRAVGISVLGMSFIASVGAVTHYVFMPFSLLAAAIGGVGGVFGALYSSKIANRLTEARLNILIGTVLAVLAICLLVKVFFWT